MRILQSSLFRALVAIVIGVLLIKYPDNTVNGITIAIGVMFLLSGLFSLLTYWNARRHVGEYKIYDAEGRLVAGEQPAFPIVGIGSIVLGCILATMSATFISMLMYVIGIILVLGAINQLMTLISARRYASVAFWYWLCPSVTLLIGLYVMVKPMAPLEMAMTVLGWLSLFYGVTEIINAWKIYSCKKAVKRMQQDDMPLIEEITEDTNNQPA